MKTTFLLLAFFTSVICYAQVDTLKTTYFKDRYEKKQVASKKAAYCKIKINSSDTLITKLIDLQTNNIIYQECLKENKPVGTWLIPTNNEKSLTSVTYGFIDYENIIECEYYIDSLSSVPDGFVAATIEGINPEKFWEGGF